MKIAIIGAGAMGCLYGAMLSEKNEVTLFDCKKQQVDAINGYGIKLASDDGSIVTYKNMKACMSGNVSEKADLVMIMTKSASTEEALAQNKELFGPETVVVSLQNGGGNEEKIAVYVKPEQILRGMSTCYCLSIGGGIVRYYDRGSTMIGTNSDNQEALNMVANALKEAGFEVEISQEIKRIMWDKLFLNVAINAFSALTNTPVGYMIQDRNAWNFTRSLIYEAVAVAEESGIYYERRNVLNMINEYCRKRGETYSSMYRDLQAGRKTDVDAINGRIVEMGSKYGVSTPYNALIVNLIHAKEGADAYRRANGLA